MIIKMKLNKTTTTTKKNMKKEEEEESIVALRMMIHKRTKSRARRRVGHDGNAAKTSPGTTRSPTLFG